MVEMHHAPHGDAIRRHERPASTFPESSQEHGNMVRARLAKALDILEVILRILLLIFQHLKRCLMSTAACCSIGARASIKRINMKYYRRK